VGRPDEFDLSASLTLGGQLGERKLGPPTCVVFEGWDASGKGGAIKRLVAQIDPRHVRVVQFAAPTADERRHHFLTRFVVVLPGWGGMAVLDRSWYGRVLVERAAPPSNGRTTETGHRV
jgi:polyphosphate kinase 2 (PPK2 family)